MKRSEIVLVKGFLLLILVNSFAFAQNTAPDFKSPCGMTSAQFSWPTEPKDAEGVAMGYYNLDFYITIDQEAQSYYWAHQYSFVGGEGAYMGLQTSADFKGERTKVAIFSIWESKNAESAPNGISGSYGHEGNGWSCRIKYTWEEGRMYRLRVWDLGAVSASDPDHWWGAWVLDTVTGIEEFIGKILVPSTFRGLSGQSLDFVEYFGNQDGQRHSCSDIEYTKSTYQNPTMNDGSIHPINISYSAYGECRSVARIGAIDEEHYQAETGIQQ